MTPAQQSALETIAGRELTAVEVTAIDPLLDPDNRQDVQITALLSAGQPPIIRPLKVEEVFAVLYASGDYMTLKQAQMGGDVRAGMAFAVLKDAKEIGPGLVELQSPATSALLDALHDAPSLLSAAGRDALLAQATAPAPAFAVNAVSTALNQAEGRMTL